ncbi:MAG: hypothetical protein JWQ09_139 [Segetibacter sp.]|nr:hypothetical protein [Segetibacter sp.]
MLHFYFSLILSATSCVSAICWLINRIDERRFCRKATKEARNAYIELRKITSKSDLPIVRRLYGNEGIKKIAS